ncbi:cupin domain-containing protein [Streptosporangium subroseum]|uniref:cupin domain-containing protein n=1 Tax=Streptosporangium subroseum TaxID=106412 RepID=UPI0034436662
MNATSPATGSLAETVAEHLGTDFRAQVFRRTHHVIVGAVADPTAVVSFAALNDIIADHRLEPPRLRLSQAGEALPQHRYAIAQTGRRNVVWHKIQPAELHQRLAEGSTLVLDAIDELCPPIGALAAQIERTLRTGVQVNAYASWTAAEGFGTHWDDHDVVVVQIEGAKRWKIYGPTRPHPTYRDVQDPEVPTGDPIDEFVLHPGDMLYLPRGHWHAVTASEGVRSLHLTCGLQTTTGVELIAWIGDQLRELDVVRADLPQFDSYGAQVEYLARLRKEITALLDRPNLLPDFFAHRDVTDPGRLAPSLPYLSGLPSEPDVTVRLLTPRAHLDGHGAAVRLRAGGQSWAFAAAAGPVLEALLTCAPFTLGELATRAGLPVSDVVGLVGELVEHQVAAVNAPTYRREIA